MALPKAGESYRLNADFGTEARVTAGRLVTVREVVKADTAGAHDDSEDAVVVEFPVHTVAEDADGNPMLDDGAPVIVTTQRAYSVGLKQFAADYTKEG